MRCPLLIILYLAICLTACDHTAEKPRLTNNQKKRIEKFSNNLVAGYNEFTPEIVKSSWNAEALKGRVKTTSNLQSNLLNYTFDKLLEEQLMLETVFLMNDIRKYNGRMTLSQIQHNNHHTDITILVTLNNTFGVMKYRVEAKGNEIFISDGYDFKTGQWFSEHLMYMMLTFDKNRSTTKQGRRMVETLQAVDQLAYTGEYKRAVEKLDRLPGSLKKSNLLSLKKLEYAIHEDEEFYSETLLKEYKTNKSPYMHYLVFLNQGDEKALSSFYRSFHSLGLSQIDTLLADDYFWN